jgi:hypothetical protein
MNGELRRETFVVANCNFRGSRMVAGSWGCPLLFSGASGLLACEIGVNLLGRHIDRIYVSSL